MKYWVSYYTPQRVVTNLNECAVDGPEAGTVCVAASSREEAIVKAKAIIGTAFEVTVVKDQNDIV